MLDASIGARISTGQQHAWNNLLRWLSLHFQKKKAVNWRKKVEALQKGWER